MAVSQLTSEQVQELLGISRSTLYHWVRTGNLVPVRKGRALLFREDDLMRALGRQPSTAVWVCTAPLAEARRQAAEWVRSGLGANVFVWIEYLETPRPDFIRAKVVYSGDHQPVTAQPGGMTFQALLRAQQEGAFLFLGHEDSVWRLHDFRIERGLREPYVALELARVVVGSDDAMRQRQIEELLDSMRQSPIREVPPYRREDLYARRPS